MSPLYPGSTLDKRLPLPEAETSLPMRNSMTQEGGFLEAWAQGYNVGSLIILLLIVFCNYRSGVYLHKLIVLELFLAIWHGTFIFISDPNYGWYLSSTATLLFISYQLHNIVSWLKIRPFLPLWGSRFFIISLICVQPFWIAEAWSNFAYFNHLGSTVNERMRPWEALLRDPWWIFTTWRLVNAIKKTYGFTLWSLVRINSRFGVMLGCMFLSIAFLLTDVAVNAAHITSSSGINPYWRFALVFKCASDTIFLDDFKSVLDDIVARKFSSAGGTVHRGSNGRRRAQSQPMTHPDAELIECTPIPPGPTTNISSPRPTTNTPTTTTPWSNPFARRGRKTSAPKIHVQQETTVTSEMRKPSQESWASERGMLRAPEVAMYAHKRGESSTSMSIGRADSNV